MRAYSTLSWQGGGCAGVILGSPVHNMASEKGIMLVLDGSLNHGSESQEPAFVCEQEHKTCGTIAIERRRN